MVAVADTSRCDRPTLSHHVWEEDTRNHGHGVISYVESSSIHHDGIGGEQKTLVIVACRATLAIKVGLFSQGYNAIENEGSTETKVHYDVHDDVYERFEELLDDTVSYSFSEVEAELAVISPRVTLLETLEDQPCGCAVSYPWAGNFENTFDLHEVG